MNASFWTLVVVVVVLGLAILFVVVNTLQGKSNPRIASGLVAAGLFGVVLGWGAFFAGISMTGQQLEFAVAGFEGETTVLSGSGDGGPQPVRSGPFGAMQVPDENSGMEVPGAPDGEENPDGGGGNVSANIIETIIKQHDKDGDGAISKEEAPEFLRSRFERIDTNKDGKCDLQEMIADRRLTPPG